MEIPEQDLEIEALNESTEWHSYLKSMLAFSNTSHLGRIARNELLNKLIVDSHSKFTEHGCKALEMMWPAKFSAMDRMRSVFCSDQADMIYRRPLAVFCPITCQCGDKGATYPPAEHFCPLKTSTPWKWIPCDQLAIVSTEFPANTSCSGDYSASSPEGMYICTPDYNGKNVYRRSTSGGVTWEIKWEKIRELGGAIVGNLNGSGRQAKWTFSSISTSSRPLGDRHFYAMSNTAAVPRQNWLPVTDQNTNLAAGGHTKCDTLGPLPKLNVKIYIGKWQLADERKSCGHQCSKVNKSCDVTIFEHMLSLHGYVDNIRPIAQSIGKKAEQLCLGPLPRCAFPVIGKSHWTVCSSRSLKKIFGRFYLRRVCWCSEELKE
jgi:hypothetical protein